MEVFEATGGEEADDGFDALDELRQIQHQHSKLLKEKTSLEHLNRDLEQQTDEHQVHLDKIKEQNKSLSALVRHLAKTCRDYGDQIHDLQVEIERAQVTLPDHLVTVTEDTMAIEKQVTQVLTEQTTNSYSDTLNLLQQEIKLLKSQVSHFQHEAHRLRVAAASASPEHVRKASTSSDDRDLDARMASLELESELAACRQREELLARQLQELLHATESRQMTFEAEAGQLQHALVQSKEYNQALTDRMDELKHQMQEMEMDSLHGGGSGSLELSMAEELNPHLSHKLSPEEEGKIIRELAELRVASTIWKEEMDHSKLSVGNLQGCYYKMLSYCTNREAALVKTIRSPPKKPKREQMLAWLQENTLRAAFDEAFAAAV